MNSRPECVAVIDAFSGDGGGGIAALLSGQLSVLRIRNVASVASCENLAERLIASEESEMHADVGGMRVLGLSHFQAVRDPAVADRYHGETSTAASRLRRLSAPFGSPFDTALALLVKSWPYGCRVLRLPTEGALAPFTIRLYGRGVGIEPHQDILSAESPRDSMARSLTGQFGANLYVSVATEGGALELFGREYSRTGYETLDEGVRVIARSDLPGAAVTLEPSIGDLVIFESKRVHSVTPARGDVPRITISFFIGLVDSKSPLEVWA